MIQYAFKNLWTQPVRSALCVVGISIAVIGVVCIFSFSAGLKSSVQSAIDLVDGVVILQKNQPDPTMSSVPVKLKKPLEESDKIKDVIPWIWTVPGSVNHKPFFRKKGFKMPELLGGVDLNALHSSSSKHLFQRKKTKGRFLKPGDQQHVVISESIAEYYSLDLGDKLPIDQNEFTVVGMYKTGNKIMDRAIVMPMEVVRAKRDLADGHVSDLVLFPAEEVSRSELIKEAEKVLLTVDKQALEKWNVRSRDEWENDFSSMMGDVDLLLFLISSLAVIVGTVGIINTMLMSITERTSEFGILIANGWSRTDIIRLVLCESTILGLVSGVVGTGIGWMMVVFVRVTFQPDITLSTPPSLLGLCFLMSVFIGVIGGVYPAYRAANKNPIDAIRSIR